MPASDRPLGPRTGKGSIAAVVPVFGEDRYLSDVVDGLTAIGLRVTVVNDGNGDALTARLRGQGVDVLDLGVNRGVGAATLAGLRAVVDRGAPGAVAVDADGAHDLVSVRAVVEGALGDLDALVACDRFSNGNAETIPITKLDANRFAAQLFDAATGARLPDVCCGLRYYPARMAASGWESAGFGFIWETLAAEHESLSRLVDCVVHYPVTGPWHTQNRELQHLLHWAGPRVSESVRATLRPLEDATADVVDVRLDDHFRFVRVDAHWWEIRRVRCQTL